jgi:hypothetical protein
MNKTTSNKSKRLKRKISAIINMLLNTIPIKIENLIRPCLYSFFQGLKKVLIIRGSEKR